MTCREAKAIVLFTSAANPSVTSQLWTARCGSLREVELAITLERGPTATREPGLA
jgi:hypothetical protein